MLGNRSGPVAEVAPLGTAPDWFHRVELRAVGRQPFELHPPRFECLEHAGRFAVGAETVPDDDKLALEFTVEAAQKSEEVERLGIVRQKLEVELHVIRGGRPGQSGHGRDPIVPIPVRQDRRLAGLAHHGR